jgi:hypothetical protein
MRYMFTLLLTLLFSLPMFSQLDPRQRYGTYLGGSQATCVDYASNDNCNGAPSSTTPATTQVTAVTVSSGNIYVAGGTNAADFPTTAGAYSRTVAHTMPFYDGPTISSDSFVAKFSSGGQLVWSTYLGVPLGGQIKAIAVDTSGNITVAGTAFTASDCRCSGPTTPPFILKLNSTGSLRTYYNEPLQLPPNPDSDNCSASGALISPVTGSAIDFFRARLSHRPKLSLPGRGHHSYPMLSPANTWGEPNRHRVRSRGGHNKNVEQWKGLRGVDFRQSECACGGFFRPRLYRGQVRNLSSFPRPTSHPLRRVAGRQSR